MGHIEKMYRIAKTFNMPALLDGVRQITSSEEKAFVLTRGLPAGLETEELEWSNPMRKDDIIERAGVLVEEGIQKIKSQLEVKSKGTPVVIGFSGGRDSTALAILTKIASPDTPVTLVTVLTGYVNEVDNPRNQAEKIDEVLEKFGIEGDMEKNHIYIDAVDAYEKHVVDEKIVHDDHNLGTAAFCSSCKVMMETRLLPKIAAKLGAGFIFNGNNMTQGLQRFAEQTETQHDLTQDWLAEKHGKIINASPLYELVHFHFDATLILEYFGIMFAEQQKEMSCALGKRPTQNLAVPDIEKFVRSKLAEFPEEVGITIMRSLKGDTDHTRLVPKARVLLEQMTDR